MAVYVLHFSGRIGGAGRNGAQHYVGYTPDAREITRLREHAAGRGAKITAAAVAHGFSLTLARVLDGGRTLERAIKYRGHLEKLCPVCTPRPHTPRAARGGYDYRRVARTDGDAIVVPA